MFINKIKLQNFRSFSNLDFSVDQGFVVLVGENGAGKSNFLQAIFFSLTLNRFPNIKYKQLFKEEQGFFRITLSLSGGDAEEAAVFSEKRDFGYRSQFKMNGQVVNRKKYIQCFSAVTFLPEDLNLLTRSPNNRRRYFDETLSGVGLKYRQAVSDYRRLLRQRNEFLIMVSDGGVDAGEIEIWDEQIAEVGSFITKERNDFIKFVNTRISKLMESLSPELAGVVFEFLPSGKSEATNYLELLRQQRVVDIKKTTTTKGPHRDDFAVFFGEREVVGSFSRGQMRAITLALKFLEYEYIVEKTKKQPVLLLDDVLSEFDAPHQKKLTEFLKSKKQVFLTSARFEDLKKDIPTNAQVFKIKNSKIEKVKN